MSAATVTPVSLLDLYQAESGILCTHRPNVLIEGPVTATEAMLILVRPHLPRSLATNLLHTPLDLPRVATNGLILREVAALTIDEQAWLLAWLDEAGSHTQVVSTTERSLFGLVEHGFFSAALYYRLNTVRLMVGITDTYPIVERAALRYGSLRR